MNSHELTQAIQGLEYDRQNAFKRARAPAAERRADSYASAERSINQMMSEIDAEMPRTAYAERDPEREAAFLEHRRQYAWMGKNAPPFVYAPRPQIASKATRALQAIDADKTISAAEMEAAIAYLTSSKPKIPPSSVRRADASAVRVRRMDTLDACGLITA